MKTKETVEVPKDILVGLFRIMCDVPSSFSSAEVYEEAKPGMKKSYDWIVEYGRENNIDSRGWDIYKKKMGK